MNKKYLGWWKAYRKTMSMIWISSKSLVIYKIVLSFLQGVIPLALLFIFKKIIDGLTLSEEHGYGDSLNELYFLTVIWGVLGIAILLTNNWSKYISELQREKLVDHVQSRIHEQSIKMDLSYYENSDFNDTLHLAQSKSVNQIKQIVDDLGQLLLNGFSIIGVLWIILNLNWLVIPIFIVSMIPGSYIRLRYAKKMYAYEVETNKLDRIAAYYNRLITHKSFIKEVKVNNVFVVLSTKFKKLRASIFEGKRKLRLTQLYRSISSNFVEILFLVGLFFYINSRAFSGEVSVGDLVFFVGAVQKGQNMMRSFLNTLVKLYSQRLYLQHLFEFFESGDREVQVLPSFDESIESIKVDDLSFSYPGANKETLSRITLEAKKGEIVAIVGRNGSGKSTLIKLLCGLYKPQSGKVLCSEEPLYSFQLSDYWSRLGTVFQDFNKYELKLIDNLMLHENPDDIDVSQLNRIIELTGIKPFIDDLPDGVSTWLGNYLESGADLSGGQWQKIALARAYYKNPEVLILDEPTSFMDGESEKQFLKTLIEDRKNSKRIIFLVSHRLSNVQIADRVYVINKGQIVEKGTPKELMENSKHYTSLFSSQFSI